MSKTIRQTWKVDDAPTDVTSAVLSDVAGAYGVKRNDTDAVVVADGTAMTHVATGVYEYTFEEPSAGLAYTAWVEIVYAGSTYRFEHDFAAVTATTGSLAVTYASLRREVGRFLYGQSDPTLWPTDANTATDMADILQSGVRRVLTPPPLPGERYGHEWSFLKPTVSFRTTAPYNTGTIAVAAGVVTLTGGTFPSWAAQGSITVPTGTYRVDTRDSDTQLTLVDTAVTVAAGATYTLGRTAYDLPTDFANINGPLVYASGQSILRNRVERTSEHQLLMDLAFEVTPSYPRQYAIRPKAIDMSASTAYELLLSPTPDASYALFYRYSVAIPALDSTTNTTPPGGDQHGELYREACLAAAEQKLHDVQGLHSARFLECLLASVSRDRRVSCPDTLGFNRDPSDQPNFDPEDHFYTQPALTRYKGIWP